MLFIALASLVSVGVVVHVALFGWRRAPAYRVDPATSQRLWVAALFAVPILLGGLIVIWRDVLVHYVVDATLLDVVLYLIGFVMAVVFGISPTTSGEDEYESLDHTAQ